jgi:hypothetical protein
MAQISQATKEKADSVKSYIQGKYDKQVEEGKARKNGLFCCYE